MRRVIIALRVAAVIACTALVLLLVVSMFATELTRVSVRTTVPSPVPLPHGVDIRQSDRLVAFLGKGTPTGQAAAITLGHVIVVPAAFVQLPVSVQQQIIEHELEHVRQRDRYWRFYLPFYGLLYLAHGYEDHPFEREAIER